MHKNLINKDEVELRSPGVEPGFREPESHVRSITLTAQVLNYNTRCRAVLQARNSITFTKLNVLSD